MWWSFFVLILNDEYNLRYEDWETIWSVLEAKQRFAIELKWWLRLADEGLSWLAYNVSSCWGWVGQDQVIKLTMAESSQVCWPRSSWPRPNSRKYGGQNQVDQGRIHASIVAKIKLTGPNPRQYGGQDQVDQVRIFVSKVAKIKLTNAESLEV